MRCKSKNTIKKSLFLLIMIACSLSSIAQKQVDEEQRALGLFNKSVILRNEGKELSADNMLLAANEIYPLPIQLNSVAYKKIQLGDVKGGNILYDAALKSLKKYGLNHTRIDKATVQKAIEDQYNNQIYNNAINGDLKIAIQVLKDYINGAGENLSINWFESINIQVSEIAFLLGDTESLKLFSDAAVKFKGKAGILYLKTYSLLGEKKYDEAIDLLKNASGGAKYWATQLFPLAYYYNGDFENLSLSVEKLPKKGMGKILPYYKGLIALNNKEYKVAMNYFNTTIKPKPVALGFGGLVGEIKVVGQFRFYTGRAEAYLGLKDLVNAKKDFEAALIYNPNYQPAIEGLTKLETNQIVAIKTDKTGPEIKILEPTNTRGLKVVVDGKDLMIKGVATDPSGLKKVTISNQNIYIKQEGDFWGSVALVDGVNKFEIIATDMAGNSTKQTFEIEKASTKVEVTPILVTEKQGKNYAMFIASQNYDDSSIPSLENPIPDAIKLKLILKNNYNFTEENIFTLFNPQRSDFKKKFLELREALQPEDNLVIFYAGHGIWVDKEKKGYWLLTDALRNNVNTWVPNKEVLDMIAELPSRHTLLITDACFSGSVFKTRSLGKDAPAAMKEMDSKITRVAITSGNDTEVPDVSVFMKYLVKALSENKEKYLTAQKMFITQIIEAVMTESKTEPRYGTLELAGHVGGDFIFTKK